jgi:phosphoglycolate phosphatase-like HAD superfamily hydrolase
MRLGNGRIVPVRNIIWDVDGTLFDTYPAIARAFRAALNDLGQDAALSRITALARVSLDECAATLARERGVDLVRLEARVAEHYERTGPDEQPPFPGARAVCDRIWSGGGQNVIVTHRGQSTVALLESNGLAKYFTGWITHADGYPRKPDPASFNAIIDRHGLRRHETLAVGDRDLDVLAGKAAGVFTCLFGTEPATVDPDLAITDFAELDDRLRAEAGAP